jgi:hypothetical protein
VNCSVRIMDCQSCPFSVMCLNPCVAGKCSVDSLRGCVCWGLTTEAILTKCLRLYEYFEEFYILL